MKRNNQRKARMEQSRRPKKNPLKAKGIESVDYKDVETLRLFISCLLYTSDAADE